jgi:CDP-diacylglycerol--serine O-phosphatidyltransferase
MKPMDPRAARRFRRGVAILPSVFTIGNLFCGFVAIIRTLEGAISNAPTGDDRRAALFIVAAILADVLDGRIARLTGTTSEFGGELDSLADSISFGVAPALLAYAWAMRSLPRIGWLTAFLFVVCGVSRLARFNVQRHAVDGRYFVGLPIPAAAGQIAALVLLLPHPIGDRLPSTLVAVMTVVLSFLMVSTFRYPSFKTVDLKTRRSYLVVLLIALGFVVVAGHPELALLGIATVYSLWGPTAYLIGLLRRRGEEAPSAPAASPSH